MKVRIKTIRKRQGGRTWSMKIKTWTWSKITHAVKKGKSARKSYFICRVISHLVWSRQRSTFKKVISLPLIIRTMRTFRPRHQSAPMSIRNRRAFNFRQLQQNSSPKPWSTSKDMHSRKAEEEQPGTRALWSCSSQSLHRSLQGTDRVYKGSSQWTLDAASPLGTSITRVDCPLYRQKRSPPNSIKRSWSQIHPWDLSPHSSQISRSSNRHRS